jgi:flagellar P-ring protein FlgI
MIKAYLNRLSLFFILFFLFAANHEAHSARIKDLIDIKGIRSNQLIGYGLVVGLDGTGDKSGTEFTVQSLANMMSQMGVYVSKNKLKVKNVAAVIITAQMHPFARIGNRIDITVSSVGDAESLAGGTLLLTPLHGVDGKVYALAQGAIALGGAGAGGQGGTSVTKNHLQTARVADDATVECEIPVQLDGKERLTLSLLNPDFTTVLRISKTINTSVGLKVAKAVDSGTLSLLIPSDMQMNVAQYIAEIEKLQVTPDTVAKIVVNEKTGTVVIGENVRISTVAISHGNMSITVKEHEEVSQPGILSRGETVTVKDTDIQIQEEKSEVILLPKSTTIGELVRALNAIGVTPRDMISIFQSIKTAGALQAELEIT